MLGKIKTRIIFDFLRGPVSRRFGSLKSRGQCRKAMCGFEPREDGLHAELGEIARPALTTLPLSIGPQRHAKFLGKLKLRQPERLPPRNQRIPRQQAPPAAGASVVEKVGRNGRRPRRRRDPPTLFLLPV